jgi:hypothetical protein
LLKNKEGADEGTFLTAAAFEIRGQEVRPVNLHDAAELDGIATAELVRRLIAARGQ